MGRQRAHIPVNHNFQDSGSVSEVLSSDEIDGVLPEQQVEGRPRFIAKIPNLEGTRSIRTVFTSQSVWNRFVEFKNGITDRQQILTLRCIVVLLACMLFWSMVSKPSPKLAESTLAEAGQNSKDEPYRSERTLISQSEGIYGRLPFDSSARSVRELDNDELSSVFQTASIDLSRSVELPEEATPAFDFDQRPAPSNSSAWDRDVYSIAPAVSGETWNSAAVPSHDSTPDFSAFAAPGYGAGTPPLTDRYSESQVRQVQQQQQRPPMAPNYGEQAAPFSSAYQTPQTTQMSQASVPYGQQYPSEANFNVTNQYQPPYRQPTHQQSTHQQSPYNPTNHREEIPATFTNNTYRNPGVPQGNPQATSPQGYYGQYNPHNPTLPSNNQQYGQQYGQPANYGNVVLPTNTLNR